MKTFAVVCWCLILVPPAFEILHRLGFLTGIGQKVPFLITWGNWQLDVITSRPGIVLGIPIYILLYWLTLISFEKPKPIDHDAFDAGPEI